MKKDWKTSIVPFTLHLLYEQFLHSNLVHKYFTFFYSSMAYVMTDFASTS